ncbi:MAG: pyruvate kinase [Pirellulaceae bacterium]
MRIEAGLSRCLASPFRFVAGPVVRVSWCVLLTAVAWPPRGASAAEFLPVPQLPPGTQFNETPPEGWTNIVLFVAGRLGSGDLSAASSTVREYSRMFNLVILADIRKRDDETYALQRYGVGFSTKIKGLNTVITTDTQKALGADLGMIGRSVFAANQESLAAIKEVARFATCVLFDAPTMMLYEDDHVMMTVRYLLWASRTTGQLSTFVWLLDRDGESGDYRLVEPAMQLLPDNMREDRVMNVMGNRFLLGIPSKDAFALVRIPQGRAVTFTPRLQQVAGAESFDATSFRALLEAISDAAQAQQPPQRSAKADY